MVDCSSLITSDRQRVHKARRRHQHRSNARAETFCEIAPIPVLPRMRRLADVMSFGFS